MSRRDQWTRKAALDSAQELAKRPSLVLVKHTAKIHARSDTAGNCPCCGSPTAKIVDEYPDLQVLVDTKGRRRWLRELPPNTRGASLLLPGVASDVGLFDRYAERADIVHDIPLRVASHCIDLVFDVSSETILATGAARSTKTQHGCVWLTRQLALRGGLGKLFLICGPSVDQAFMVVKKLIEGEGDDNPAIIPDDLVLRRPASMREQLPIIQFLDGTECLIKHTANPKRLGGRRYESILYTEASGTPDEKAYAQIRGRTVSSQGQLYADAVPVGHSWVYPAIVKVAEEEDEKEHEAEKKGEAFARTVRVQHLQSIDNPWLEKQEAIKFREALLRVNPILAAREADGQWVPENEPFFGGYFDPAKHTYEYEGWDVCDHLELKDITHHASTRWFRNSHDYLISVDINKNPNSALVGLIACPKNANPRDPEKWLLICHAVTQSWADPVGRAIGDKRVRDTGEAASMLATEWDGILAGAGVVIDASSTYKGHNAGGVIQTSRNCTPREDYEKAGFEVRGPDRWPTPNSGGTRNYKNPSVKDTSTLVRRMLRDDRILINKTFASRLINALKEVESDPTGTMPVKHSNTNLDRYVSSLIDCIRYLVWPWFHPRTSDKYATQPFVQRA